MEVADGHPSRAVLVLERAESEGCCLHERIWIMHSDLLLAQMGAKEQVCTRGRLRCRVCRCWCWCWCWYRYYCVGVDVGVGLGVACGGRSDGVAALDVGATAGIANGEALE